MKTEEYESRPTDLSAILFAGTLLVTGSHRENSNPSATGTSDPASTAMAQACGEAGSVLVM